MDNKIGATLEMLEEKIESIKWLVITSFPVKKSGISSAVHLIRRSAGILTIPKGTIVENKLRGEWETNSYNIGLVDSLIAATAYKNKSTLITRNIRHFSNIKEIQTKSV